MDLEIVHPKDFEKHGIDPLDVPKGMLVSLSVPPMLAGKYGGNVYGIGVLETFTTEEDSISHESLFAKNRLSEYKRLNFYYKSKGLLTRVTKELKPYYLIPVQVASQFNIEVKFTINELAVLINTYKAESLKQYLRIGIFTQENSIVLNELRARFQDDDIECIPSFDTFSYLRSTFDLAILPEDLNTWIMRNIHKFDSITISDCKSLALYFVTKVYKIISEDGRFIIWNRFGPNSHNKTLKVEFKNEKELKLFILYCKLFAIKYNLSKADSVVKVKCGDFLRYIERYHTLINSDISTSLPGDKSVDSASIDEVQHLKCSEYRSEFSFNINLAEAINKFFPRLFYLGHGKKIGSPEILELWAKKFQIIGEEPFGYFWVGVFKRKAPRYPSHFFLRAIDQDKLRGCARELIADYRDSFKYVVSVLEIVSSLHESDYPNVLKQHSDRLRLPLKSKMRRHKFLEHVIKLSKKLNVLQELDAILNPKQLEGPFTSILNNLDILSLMGFEDSEINELLRIVAGHSPMGRILLGKLHEERMMAIVDYAKTLGPDEGLNLMRFLRLMTAAELQASMGRPLSAPQMAELFELYERYSMFVANPELKAEEMVPRKEFLSGEALKSSVIKRILRLMGYHEFVQNAEELVNKGEKELEVISHFDEHSLKRLKRACRVVEGIQRMMEEYWERSTGFEAFAQRLRESEFHGTGRLFQRVSVEVVLNILWIVLGVSNEGILNLNPVLKGLTEEEGIRRIKKIERELGREEYRKIPWADLIGLREELQRTKNLLVPGTGLLLSTDSRLNALMVGYQDVVKDLKKCSTLLGRASSEGFGTQGMATVVEMDQVIQRLSTFVESQRDRPKGIFPSGSNVSKGYRRRYERAVAILRPAKEWVVREALRPNKIYERMARLWEASPLFFARLTNSLESGMAGRVLEALRMFQALIDKDVEGFYDPDTLALRIKQEFGSAGVAEIGASKDELNIISSQLEAIGGDGKMLMAFTLCLIAFSKTPSKEENQLPQRFLGEEFDEFIPREVKALALKLYECAEVILQFPRGIYPLSELKARQSAFPDLFLASAILGFLATQAFHLSFISKDFLSLYIYPFISQANFKASIREEYTKGINRLLRLKNLLYVTCNDVTMYEQKVPPRYLLIKKGFSDVGIVTFEKELYEATRLYNTLRKMSEEYCAAVESLLESQAKILGVGTILNYLTYDNQVKLMALLWHIVQKEHAFDYILDLRPIAENIDTTYETINKSLTNLDYNELYKYATSDIFLVDIDKQNKLLTLYFYPDIEIKKLLGRINEIDNIDLLRSYYFEVIKKASEYYVVTDKIEKKLNFMYREKVNSLVDSYLQRLINEIRYLSDFSALERHKIGSIEKAWEMGLPKEAITKVEHIFEQRKGELRQKKLVEIKETLGSITLRNEVLAYWEEVKRYLVTNKASLGQDYLLLVARLFDEVLSKL